MWKPDYLKFMPKFKEAIEKLPIPIVDQSMDLFEPIIKQWAEFIHRQFTKGLTPLFITGSGMSIPDVPDIVKIVEQLKLKYDEFKKKANNPELKENMNRLFELWDIYSKKDRSVVARILNTFQDEKDELYPVWQDLNRWLLEEILKAEPSPSHDKLVKLYEDFGAICITLNFDGLLVRKLNTMFLYNVSEFVYPSKGEVEVL